MRNIYVGLVGEQQGRADADHRTDDGIDADRERGMKCREQPGRDERRRSACNDRGELIADGRAAVAQPRRERFRDKCGFSEVPVSESELFGPACWLRRDDQGGRVKRHE